MEYKHLIMEQEGALCVLTVNRPDALNALNSKVLEELRHAVDAIAADKDLRVVIPTGAGPKAFVAGADIKELKENTPLSAKHVARMGQELFTFVERLGSLILSCDTFL